ncbi:phage holin family protein [Candidatus Pantoea carbekii]|uniref:phage holin family protein n=1 Tax=Candidatus Pantoea carbekii TaxID=1235990 RepID=UPI00061876CA|nr:phage holin family protein [Candidatus Pantoea carbekii]AKC32539.1 membrane protein [Candidatus Pantoea carbekii]
MNDDRLRQGPAKTMFNIGQRIVTMLVKMAETRIQLAISEIEEEKIHLIKLLIMISFTLLFFTVGLISLMGLIIMTVNEHYRFLTIVITTAVLFTLAIALGIWTLHQSRRLTLLRHTRRELTIDRQLLKEYRS